MRKSRGPRERLLQRQRCEVDGAGRKTLWTELVVFFIQRSELAWVDVCSRGMLTNVGPRDKAHRGRLYATSEAPRRVRARSSTMSMVMRVRGRTSGEVEAGCAGKAAGEGADGGREVD